MIDKLLVRPWDIDQELIRFGSAGDGGYVANKGCLDQCDYCFSYGINGIITFEEDWEKFSGKCSYLYDHTCDAPPNLMPKMTYFKEGLGGNKTDNCNNFLNHYKDLNLNGQVLLKMDVESCEYDWILNTNIDQLSKIVPTLIIEFHWIQNFPFEECINKIKSHYNITHLHPNNYGALYNGIPNVPEITFLRKDSATFIKPTHKTYPLPILDSPNNNKCPDLIIDYSYLEQYE
jgi:hypothetical protein